MAGITLAQAQTALTNWLDADAALSRGEAYTIAGRSVTRAETLEKIKYWDRKVKRLSSTGGSGIPVRGVTLSS